MVHFFLYDYKFEDIWRKPDKYIERLSMYRGVLSPDFSMYIEMSPALQRYNTFRNRWVGAYLSKKGIKVAPTINWGLENTFEFCFEGVEKGSTVAVSTYMASSHGNTADQKEFFMKGYNEMLRRIEPETVICYHYPFPEMEGNILFVDYDLSSWQHYDDDENVLPYTQSEKYILGIDSIPKSSNIIIKRNCSIIYEKGSGSAFGGKWQPNSDKPWEKRFFGKPGEINHTFIPTNKGGYWADTKIGEDGRAVKERHYSDHSKPHTHSNPHDNSISWNDETGEPIWGKDKNYFDGDIPEFKYYMITGEYNMNIDYDGSYKTKYEFKKSVSMYSEICFEWKGVEYGIFPAEDKQWLVCLLGEDDSNDVYYKNIDDVMNHKIGDDRLIDICTKFTVIERTF